MKRRIIFHIGLEKTGTDSFQRFCKNNRTLLSKYGVLYPMRSLAFAKYNHRPLVACYLPYDDFGISKSRETRASVIQSLMTEINTNIADTILISAEHFSSRFTELEIFQLASDFSDYDCKIAVVVREHGSRIYSAYCQSILSGSHMTIDEFCDANFHPSCRYARYKDTVGLWDRAFGTENVSVFCYHSGENVIQILCENLVSPSMPLATSGSYWDNMSIGLGPAETLRTVNEVIARLPGAATNYATWLLLRHVRRAFGKLLVVIAGLKPKGPLRLMSERNRCRMEQIAEADWIWLKEHHGVRLPGPGTG
jgi:hypothetical protein